MSLTRNKWQLKDGSFTYDKKLDRVYQLDWNSLDYAVGSVPDLATKPHYRPRSMSYKCDLWLNQYNEGACVSFAHCHELAAYPQKVMNLSNEFAREQYFAMQRQDEWPGGAYPGADPFYEGTSILAGAQIMKELGFYESYWWALTLEEFCRALAYFGPAVIGVIWTEGMMNTDPYGFIHPHGRIVGGHGIAVIGLKIIYKDRASLIWRERTWADVDWDKSYIVLHNSWGRGWGVNGRAKLALSKFGYLLAQQGDAMFPKRTGLRDVFALAA